ncbi:unnamed protein product [Caenorhabditis brenneri]
MLPLFRIPFLAQKEILSTMEPGVLVPLAMASKRAKHLVATCTTKGNYTLSINFDTDILVTVAVNGVRSSFKVTYKKPAYPASGPLEKNDMDRVLSLSDLMCDIFHCRVKGVYIYKDLCNGHVKQIVDWLLERQETIERLVFQGISLVGHELAYILKKCVVTKLFQFSITGYPEDPRSTHPRFKMDYLIIDDVRSSWITLDDILSFDCEFIRLSSFKFNENDMNRFLKAWMNGSNSRLSFLEIELPYLDHAKVIDGLALEEDIDVAIRFQDPEGYPNCRIEGGTHIRRPSDGRLAVFQQESPYFNWGNRGLMTRTSCLFRMLVWGG